MHHFIKIIFFSAVIAFLPVSSMDWFWGRNKQQDRVAITQVAPIIKSGESNCSQIVVTNSLVQNVDNPGSVVTQPATPALNVLDVNPDNILLYVHAGTNHANYTSCDFIECMFINLQNRSIEWKKIDITERKECETMRVQDPESYNKAMKTNDRCYLQRKPFQPILWYKLVNYCDLLIGYGDGTVTLYQQETNEEMPLIEYLGKDYQLFNDNKSIDMDSNVLAWITNDRKHICIRSLSTGTIAQEIFFSDEGEAVEQVSVAFLNITVKTNKNVYLLHYNLGNETNSFLLNRNSEIDSSEKIVLTPQASGYLNLDTKTLTVLDAFGKFKESSVPDLKFVDQKVAGHDKDGNYYYQDYQNNWQTISADKKISAHFDSCFEGRPQLHVVQFEDGQTVYMPVAKQ